MEAQIEEQKQLTERHGGLVVWRDGPSGRLIPKKKNVVYHRLKTGGREIRRY